MTSSKLTTTEVAVPALPSAKRHREQSLSSSSENGIPLIIPDATIIRGVQKEVVRTLPFWRCFLDLWRRLKWKPVLMDCEITLLCRLPCKFFPGVDVVWAVAEARVRARTQLKRRLEKANHEKTSFSPPDPQLSRCWDKIPYEEHLWRLGTMQFVHHDAHKNGNGNSRSYHIQSVVFMNQPELLQCVAGTMMSFAFTTYTALLYLDYKAFTRAVSSPSPTVVCNLPSNEARHSSLQRESTEPTPQEGVVVVGNDSGACNFFHSDPALLLFSHASTFQEKGSSQERLKLLCPPPLRRILILGMGGNSMATSLRYALGGEVDLHVVEIEPAVSQACERAGLLPNSADDAHFHLHLEDAVKCLKGTLSTTSFDMIFMDLFEPTEGKMKNDMRISNLCFSRLQVGGLLVVNIHQLPSLLSLRSFERLFGLRNIQAVNLHGWKESVVVCVKVSSTPNWKIQGSVQGTCKESKSNTSNSRDGLLLQCDKKLADKVFKCYEEVLPGWLLHHSWLKKSKKVGDGNRQCRIWES